MDVSSFLKWEERGKEDTMDASKRNSQSNLALSFVQDNISSFFGTQNGNGNGNDSSDSLVPQASATSKKSSNDSASINSQEVRTPTTTMTSSFSSFKQKQQSQLTDIFVEKLLAMALPPNTELGANVIEGRVQAGKTRPQLSVPIMSKNFIQLNSRLSFPFEMIDHIIRFFTWENPTLTLTILTLYTHVVLKPLPTLMSFPFFFILLYIMTPAYTNKHIPDQHTVLGKNNPVLANGPDLKNPNIPTPASEFSKEFLLNLTDLQNHMVLYVYGWDVVVHLLSKFAYFTDEAVSPFYFLTLLIIGLVSVSFGDLIFPLIPIKFILITTGWAVTVVFHPYFYDYVFNMVYSEETRYYILGKTNKVEDILHKHFDLEEPPEQKEVEIFEIHQFNKSAKEWHLVFFLNDDFTKISPSRLSYDEHSPIGSLNKSSIKPPKDWEFITDEDWKIDLYPDSWVKSHLLEGVVRIDIETKWVYDLADDDNGYQPQFRRRRWTRVVTRHSDILDGKSAVTTPKKKRTGSGGSIEEH